MIHIQANVYEANFRLTSPNRRFSMLSKPCCLCRSPRTRTTLPTAQQEMADAISCFRLTHPLPISYRGLTEKIPLSEKISEIDRTNIVNRTVCRKAATSCNEGLAQWRHYLAWKDFAIFARCWLAMKMCWKPPPRQAPERCANMADSRIVKL